MTGLLVASVDDGVDDISLHGPGVRLNELTGRSKKAHTMYGMSEATVG